MQVPFEDDVLQRFSVFFGMLFLSRFSESIFFFLELDSKTKPLLFPLLVNPFLGVLVVVAVLADLATVSSSPKEKFISVSILLQGVCVQSRNPDETLVVAAFS